MDERGVKFAPKRYHLVVILDATVHLFVQFCQFILGFLDLEAQRCLLALQCRKRPLSHLQILLQILQRCFVKLISNSHIACGYPRTCVKTPF